MDRLAQAQWFERLGFLLAAIAGSVFIVAAKVGGLGQIPTTLIVLVLMSVYAFVVWRSMAGRMRADQAGDNLYYLGLLYTLTGLAYAIFSFRPESSTSTIIQGFGIALATTIYGLMLRVFFNQLRVDLVEVEESARVELAQASQRLKASLNQIIVELNDFGRLTRQSLAEAATGVEAGLVEAVSASGDRMAKLADIAQSSAEAAFKKLDTQAETLGTATGKINEVIESYAGSLKTMDGAVEQLNSRVGTLLGVSEALEASSAAIRDQASAATELQREVAATVEANRSNLTAQGEVVKEIEGSVQSIDAAVKQSLHLLENLPKSAIRSTQDIVGQALQELRKQTDDLGKSHAAALRTQAELIDELTEISRKHNAGLAAELEQSRAFVNQVHSALVEMTSELRRQVDAAT